MRASVVIGLAVAANSMMLAATARTDRQAASPSTPQGSCESLRSFHQPDVTIIDASLVPAGQLHPPDNVQPAQRSPKPYCRVEARIEGNIGFLAWLPLPEDWNGRVLGVGNGGDAGSFALGGIAGAVRQGMVGLTTDAGHQSNTDPLWAMSRKKMEDYTHRAQHLTAVLGRDLTAAYYGKDPSKSYFMGCSGGGRQAQKEMQTFPDDYDGIVAGAPASQHAVQMARKQWIVLAQEQQPEAALSEPQWDNVQAEVVKQCDAADGLTDGLVDNPMACKFDVTKLACPAGQTGASCLTPAQIGMVNLMYRAFKDENGVERGPRPILGIRPQRAAPVTGVQAFGHAVHQNPNWTRKDLNIAKDVDALNRILPEMSPDNPDLTRFVKHGGKAILYQGWRDSTDMAAYTIQNYERMVAYPANGGLKKVQESVRLFEASISGHCGGNDGPTWQTPGQPGYSPDGDLLQLTIRWVEQDRAPETVLASQVKDGKVVRTRPLCPYPAYPHYKGTGSIDAAESFVCRQ
jgi:feruloyl esterase